MDTATISADNPGTVTPDTAPAPQQEAPQAPDYSTMENGQLVDAMAAFFASGGTPQTEEGASLEQDQQIQSAEPTLEQPEPGVAIPDKFLNPDGSANLELMAKSYLELETAFHQRNQQPPEWQQEKAWFQQQMDNLLKAQPQPAQDEAPPSAGDQMQEVFEGMTAEQQEKWFENFYANPLDSLKELVSKIVDPIVQPIQAEREFQQSVQNNQQQLSALEQKYGSLQPVLPYMDQISREMPFLADQPDAMDRIFKLAVDRLAATTLRQNTGQQTQQQTPPQPAMTPEQMAADPAVQQMVIANHIKGLQQGAPPPVMGSQPGRAGMPASPAKEIRNLKDAAPAIEAYMRQAMNGG